MSVSFSSFLWRFVFPPKTCESTKTQNKLHFSIFAPNWFLAQKKSFGALKIIHRSLVWLSWRLGKRCSHGTGIVYQATYFPFMKVNHPCYMEHLVMCWQFLGILQEWCSSNLPYELDRLDLFASRGHVAPTLIAGRSVSGRREFLPCRRNCKGSILVATWPMISWLDISHPLVHDWQRSNGIYYTFPETQSWNVLNLEVIQKLHPWVFFCKLLDLLKHAWLPVKPWSFLFPLPRFFSHCLYGFNENSVVFFSVSFREGFFLSETFPTCNPLGCPVGR